MAGTKSYIHKTGEVVQRWWTVDATDKVVGRLASELAMVLMGKHRPDYTPHVLSGDCIVLLNCEKVKFTGNKWQQKKYTWYTGYPRQRSEKAEQTLAKNPEEIIKEAVRRMLPKNKLGVRMLSNLKVYKGTEHPHQAQKPEPRKIIC